MVSESGGTGTLVETHPERIRVITSINELSLFILLPFPTSTVNSTSQTLPVDGVIGLPW